MSLSAFHQAYLFLETQIFIIVIIFRYFGCFYKEIMIKTSYNLYKYIVSSIINKWL